MQDNDEKTKPYYGRDRREGRDRRMARSADRRRAQAILPPPSLLEVYEAAAPGSVETLLDMAQQELEHRHEWEDNYATEYVRTFRMGQLFGVMISLMLICFCFYLILVGKETGALILAGGGFGAMALASFAATVAHNLQFMPEQYTITVEGADEPLHNRREDD